MIIYKENAAYYRKYYPDLLYIYDNLGIYILLN